MGSFKNTILTQKAHALMAKLAAGTATSVFTKVKTSNHDYSALTSSQLESLTTLEDIKQEVSVSEVKRINDTSVKVTATLLNTKLTEGYYIKAIGLYAQDPDEGEILYSVTIAIESDWMPPFNNITSASALYELVTTVSNAENVSIEVDPNATVSITTFNEFKENVNGQLSNIINKNLVADMQSKTYNIGDKIFSKLYGGSYWEVKAEVRVEGQLINFTDELHVIVNKVGGGTAVAECQISSVINYAKSMQTKKYVDAFTKLRRRKATSIVNYGDSVTFGQYVDPSAIKTKGTATNFGDDSKYEFDQLPTPYPAYLAAALNNVYNGTVPVINKGYSGDRVGSAYCRHLKFSGQDICTMEYGINDQLYCSANGAYPDRILTETEPYCLNNFMEAYRKMIVREQLRGSAVILIAPHRHHSLVGYDGTNFSSAKLLVTYQNAIYALGKELGVLVVDANEFLGDYPMNQVTLDGLHLNDFGSKVMGYRLASLFIGRGYLYTERIAGERELTCSSAKDNIEQYSNSDTIINIPDTNGFNPPYYNATDSEVIVIQNNAKIYYSFYLEEDKKYFMPVGRIQNAILKYEIDFGITQAEYKLDVEDTDIIASRTVPSSSKIIDSSSATTHINSIDDISSHICIQGKGWHTVTISITSGEAFVLNGLRFFNSLPYWKQLTLSSGISTFGTIPRSYKIEDGVCYFRGIIVNNSYTEDKKICDYPSEMDSKLPALTYPVDITFNNTNIIITLKTDGIYWKANSETANNCNIFNLANLKIVPYYM